MFYGCIRYEEFLKVFCKIFFERHPVGTNRNDLVMYMIFGYLSFFRLEELAIEDYRKLILSQDSVKMHVFLQFVFNADELRETVRDKWMEIYDYSYIDDKIIGGIEKNLPNVSEILKTVERKATGKVASGLSQSGASQTNISDTQSQMTALGKQSVASADYADEPAPKQVTKIVPFNLTEQKPKMMPAPQEVVREVKANPVPKNLFKNSLAKIEQEKSERRLATATAVKREYAENRMQRFALATESRPTADKF